MCIRDRTYSMLFGMSRRAASIVLTPEEGSTLARWSRGRSIPARLVLRARIVRLAAQGRQSQDIAEELDISRPTVQLLSLIHISEPTRRTPISYAVFCLKKKKQQKAKNT